MSKVNRKYYASIGCVWQTAGIHYPTPINLRTTFGEPASILRSSDVFFEDVQVKLAGKIYAGLSLQ
jgi:hypothetical protein